MWIGKLAVGQEHHLRKHDMTYSEEEESISERDVISESLQDTTYIISILFTYCMGYLLI